MTTKAYSLADAALKAISSHLDQYQAEKRLIQSHPDYSDAWKQRTTAQRRDMYSVQAKQEFRAAWKSYQQAKKQALAAVTEARQAKDADLNWSQIQVLSQEYASRIKNPPPGRTRAAVLDDLAQQASASKEARRAYALAASEYLSSGDTAQAATRARHLVRQWEEEAVAPVDEAERQAAAFDAIEPELRRRALEVEAAFLGKSTASVWGGISEWQRDVLQEDAVKLGYVVWHDDTAAASQPLPTATAPGGVENS